MNEMDELMETLALTADGLDKFRGRVPDFGWSRIFGGHLIAQALAAASNTTAEDRFVHSLHAYFHNPGDVTQPVHYAVERTRDGRSFSARQIRAVQDGKALLTMETSFHVDEGGPNHQSNVPPENIPRPDSLTDPHEFLSERKALSSQATRELWSRPSAFEVKPMILDHYISQTARQPLQQVWIRPRGEVHLDRTQTSVALAFLSDISLLGVGTFAEGGAITDPGIQSSSISHAMWFHRPFEMNDWLLYSQESPSSQNALALARGNIYTKNGILVATVVQEGLVRFSAKR